MGCKVIATENAPGAVGPYSQAVVSGGFLFSAGQIALDPKTMTVVEGDVQAQTRQVMKNLSAVLEEAGIDFSKVVKTTIFLESMDDFVLVNEIYAKYFTEAPPARSTVAVRGLPLGVQVEIEVIAHIDD